MRRLNFGKTYLAVKILGGLTVSCWKYEPKMTKKKEDVTNGDECDELIVKEEKICDECDENDECDDYSELKVASEFNIAPFILDDICNLIREADAGDGVAIWKNTDKNVGKACNEDI